MISKTYSRRRFSAPLVLAVSVALITMILVPASRAQETAVQIDPAATKIEFSLGSTMHTVHGKFTLKSNSLRFDPSTGKIAGTIIVDATSGESGNSSRDGRMHREILESVKFPEIIFTPTEMTGSIAAAGSSKVEVSGRFHLHGQDHDVTLPVEVTSDGKVLQIAIRFEIPYVQWGLKNPSNFFLRVADKVAINIEASGHLQPEGNP